MRKRVWALIVIILGAAWAGFELISANSPEDVQTRLTGWGAALDTAGAWLWSFFTAIVSNPIVTGILGLCAGFAIGFFVAGWKSAGGSFLPWNESLAIDMNTIVRKIDEYGSRYDNVALNADMTVLQIQLQKRRFSFPKVEEGYRDVAHVRPYLVTVAKMLEVGLIDEARDEAKRLSTPRV